MGSLIDLFLVATMPIVKVLLITALGLFLALNRIGILGETATNHLNKVVFFVLSPALVGSNLARSVTIKSFLNQWFMILNVLLTFLMGSALGWVLGKVTKAPKHVMGLIVASCSAGNLGNLPLIILPAMCKEKGSPFGASDVCERNGLAYASLSLAIGTIYFWLYAYNIVRISSKDAWENAKSLTSTFQGESPITSQHRSLEDLALSSSSINQLEVKEQYPRNNKNENKLFFRMKQRLRIFSEEFNLKAVLAPSTIGAIVGFIIGMISPLRKMLMDNKAPLHVVGDTSFMIGDASIPCSTLILGANLQRGLKGSGIRFTTLVGIIVVRYIFLPLLGVLVVKGAVIVGFVQSHDTFFQYALLLQYALPPATTIGTVTELFGVGQKECSVIMLWTNILAPVTLTVWSTIFLWLLS